MSEFSLLSCWMSRASCEEVDGRTEKCQQKPSCASLSLSLSAWSRAWLTHPFHPPYLPPQAVDLRVQVKGRIYRELDVTPSSSSSSATEEVLPIPQPVPFQDET